MRIEKYKLSDLYVRVYTENGFKVVKIPESEVYQSLIDNDKERYTKYHNLVRRKYNQEDTHTYDKFSDLLNDISVNDFELKYRIKITIRTGLPEIIDGQHRAAILYIDDSTREVDVEVYDL